MECSYVEVFKKGEPFLPSLDEEYETGKVFAFL
jgi:hypothetical protein